MAITTEPFPDPKISTTTTETGIVHAHNTAYRFDITNKTVASFEAFVGSTSGDRIALGAQLSTFRVDDLIQVLQVIRSRME